MPERRRPAGTRPGARAGRADDAVLVREATPADLDVVLALRLALLREHAGNPVYGRLRADAERTARPIFAGQLRSEVECTLLAVDRRDDAVLGILRCMEGRGSPLLDPPRYAYVASVYVQPAARQRGVLRRLLDAADAWSRARGLDEMRLHVAADNAGANAAWGALGFDVAEHLRVRRIPPR